MFDEADFDETSNWRDIDIGERDAGGSGRSAHVRAPAPVQVTAEQLILDSRVWSEGRADVLRKTGPRIELVDEEEVEAVLKREREKHEVRVNTRKKDLTSWLRFCHFEEAHRNLDNARHVYERALVSDYEAVPVWTSYVDMELRNRFVNRARNVLERAVYLLPKVHQLWYRYVYLEELVGDYVKTRRLFAKWMEWRPHAQAWASYIRFERRCGELDNARELFKRLVLAHNTLASWLKWARFEERRAHSKAAAHAVRDVFEQALEISPRALDCEEGLLEDHQLHLRRQELQVRLHAAYAAFETRFENPGRARERYRRALDHLEGEHSLELRKELYDSYIAFEKQHGDTAALADLVYVRLRFRYEQLIARQPRNWDAWFDFAKLEQQSLSALSSSASHARSLGDRTGYLAVQQLLPDGLQRVRSVFSRATALRPESDTQKRHWQRYVWLFIASAVFEEQQAHDVQRARASYAAGIAAVPHAAFTFSRLWVMAAEFELRQKNLPAARRLLGSALGYRPSYGVFEAYIAIEQQLGQFDRCRSLCEKMLQRFPLHSRAWRFFAAFESALQEPMRARTLFELALERSQQLDSPELVWRDFLAFELKQGNQPAVRSIYERLLAQLPSVQVWLNYASFEAFAQQPERARAIYRRCWELLQKVSSGFPSERSSLLDAWMVFERQHGDVQSQASVDALIQQQQHSLQVVAAATSDSPSALPTIAVISSQLSLAERARRWKEQRNANLSTNQ